MIDKKTNAWALRYSLPRKADLPSDEIIVYVNGGRLRIKPGDKVVLLEQSPLMGPQFYAYTTVTRVQLVQVPDDVVSDNVGERNALQLALDLPTRLDSPRQLRTFAESLLAVTNHKAPAKQFLRSTIKKIPIDDYTTILDGEIFLARTFFIKTYINMSRKLRFGFQTYCMKHGCDVAAPNVHFKERARLMVDFIKTQILPIAEYLLLAKQTYDRIECVEKPAFGDLLSSSDNGQTVRALGALAAPAQQIVELAQGQQGILDIMVDELSKTFQFRFERLRWTAIQW